MQAEPDSVLHALLTTPPSQQSSFLATSTDVEVFYTVAANSGDTATPEQGEEVDWHYTAFVPDSDGKKVIELDGDQWGPVVHGDLTNSGKNFGSKAREVIKKEYFEKDKGSSGMFSILALVRSGEE